MTYRKKYCPEIHRVVENVRPSSFLEYTQFLRAVYRTVKRKTKEYTYLKFSYDLGFSETNLLNQIINGNRNLTETAALKICSELKITGKEKKYLIHLVKYVNTRKHKEREEAFDELLKIKSERSSKPLEKDKLEFFSEWYHVVIREMIGLPDFKNSIEWICKKLSGKVLPEQVKKSLEMLERLKLVEKDQDSIIKNTSLDPSTPQEAVGHAIASFHQQMMQRAKESIPLVGPKRRDISALSLRISEKQAQAFKALIHDFEMKLLNLESEEDSANRDQIYQLNVQFFPFTNTEQKK